MSDQIRIFSSPPSTTTPHRDEILLDGSGSMRGPRWWDSLAAIDSYVATLHLQGVQTHIRLTTFDSTDLELVARDTPIGDWVPLAQSPIGAHWGGTPLYDAINVLGRKLRAANPPRAAITIVTDGETAERDNTFTSLDQAKQIIDWMRAMGWQVTFIGCDWDNSAQAKLLGANPASAIGTSAKRLVDAARILAEKRARYGRTGEDMHFTDAERTKFGGYLGR